MIEQPISVTILYTAALEGRIDLLPRLFSCLRRERASAAMALLVDLGRACAAGSWICESTGGRGMLVAMDAMGYDAFHIGQLDMLYTQPALVQQIKQMIATPLAAGPWTAKAARQGCTFQFTNAAAMQRPTEPIDLIVALRLSLQPAIQVLHEAGQRLLLIDSGLPTDHTDPPLLGRVDVALLPELPLIQLISHTRLHLPADALPDPTISGVVEFVESEARLAEKKRS